MLKKHAAPTVCSGPKHWNKLPDIIKCAPSLKVFKNKNILASYLTTF